MVTGDDNDFGCDNVDEEALVQRECLTVVPLIDSLLDSLATHPLLMIIYIY